MSARRILIVDDNADLAENISEILADLGYEADVYDDPRRALSAMKAGRYGLAILDLRMPHLDGVELYGALTAVDPALPAIAMTAYARDDRVEAAVQAGMIAIVNKPLELPALLTRLRAVVDGQVALVVEDEPHLAQNLVELLADKGFSGRVAHDCAQARALVQAVKPAVLLVDLRLPDGDGISLLGELQPQCAGAVKLLFSGYAQDVPGTEEAARAQGAYFLQKPLDLGRLLRLLSGASPS